MWDILHKRFSRNDANTTNWVAPREKVLLNVCIDSEIQVSNKHAQSWAVTEPKSVLGGRSNCRSGCQIQK